jgi:phospholipase C
LNSENKQGDGTHGERSRFSRRRFLASSTALAATVGGAVLLGSSRMARNVAETSTLKFMPPPVPVKFPIEHIVVIMEENHTFDNYFGTYPGANGIAGATAQPSDVTGAAPVQPFVITTPTISRDMDHSWTSAHTAFDGGKMDGFVTAAGTNQTMGYFDPSLIDQYWKLASDYVLLDNFYTSVMGPSLPNHLYLIAAQSGGLTGDGVGGKLNFTSETVYDDTFHFKCIMDELDQVGVSWKYYAGGSANLNNWNPMPGFASFKESPARLSKVVETQQFVSDLENHVLPSVSWIMPASDDTSEHPPYDITTGEQDVMSIVNAIMSSDYWPSTAIFLTWDDWGGWYDHVTPPQVDGMGYGFRVPCLVVSPYAKRGAVDHTQGDFTSILKFVETVHSLGPLTPRDASASDLMEAFDFTQNLGTPRVTGYLLPSSPLKGYYEAR